MTPATTTPRSTRRMKAADYAGFPHAQGRRPSTRQAARHRHELLHRGLRHRAVGGGRLARRRRRPLGIGRGARQRGRHDRGADRLAQPRPGPRDDLRATGQSSASACRSTSVSIVHGDTDKVQMGMGTYGSRSGAVGMSAIVKALDKVEAKAKKIAAHLMEADEGDIVIENGALKVAGTDKKRAVVPDGARRLHRAQPARRHGAGAEGDGVLRSVQLHLPGRLLHLRGRDRSRHRARPRSCSSSPPTISATSSTR